MTIPDFFYREKIEMAGRGIVYFGQCPWTDCVRATAKGRQVRVDGEVKTVLGIEAFAKMSEPRFGESIGLLLT